MIHRQFLSLLALVSRAAITDFAAGDQFLRSRELRVQKTVVGLTRRTERRQIDTEGRTPRPLRARRGTHHEGTAAGTDVVQRAGIAVAAARRARGGRPQFWHQLHRPILVRRGSQQ